jgi:hypothetical protein
MVTYAQVHDLSAYSSRIEGIGVEKPYYSPYIAKKKDDDGWFPENVLPLIGYVRPTATPNPWRFQRPRMRWSGCASATEEARTAGKDTLRSRGSLSRFLVAEAEDITKAPSTMCSRGQAERSFDPEKFATERRDKLGAKKSLIFGPTFRPSTTRSSDGRRCWHCRRSPNCRSGCGRSVRCCRISRRARMDAAPVQAPGRAPGAGAPCLQTTWASERPSSCCR